MSKQRFVIVGGGLAGAKAAQELRDQGFDGDVTLIGAEPERPYERPDLSKTYLQGTSERDKLFVHDAGFYAEHDIELMTGTTVSAVDPAASRVTLDGGRQLEFDKLLLATGAEPRRLSVPGADLDGVFYLRTLANCDVLKARFAEGGHAVVIGSGWIGSEVAASARQLGLEVTVIDPVELPNLRIFGREIGEFYRDVHLQHGVQFLLGDGVAALEGDTQVRRVHTSSGKTVECDFVVAAVGVTPAVELAKDAGLELDNGVLVDEHLATSAPNIYAVGDIANELHPFYNERIRVEHWANALNQGPVAARSMLGQDVSYDRIPYFYSDQYDVGMEYSGYTTEWDEVVFRGDRASGEFIAFWVKNRQVLAGMNVNVWEVNDKVQALIRSRKTIDPAALSNPDTPLEDLV